jgi:tetratricopeptide (TPR) repeat protein
MSYEEDFKVIKSRLTGDRKTDLQILFSCYDEFSKRPYSNELDCQISSLIEEIMKNASKEENQSLTRYINSVVSNKYNKSLLQIRNCLDKHQAKKALHLVETLEGRILFYIDKIKSNEPGVQLRFYFSTMQFELSTRLYPAKFSTVLFFDYVSLLTLKSQAYYLLNRSTESLESLKKAFEIDPVSPDLCFLQADYDASKMNWISFLMDLDKAHRFLYTIEDCYRYYYYVASYFKGSLKDQEMAKAIVLAFSKSRQPLYLTVRNLPLNVLTALQIEKIPLDVDEDIIRTAVESAQSALRSKNDDLYKYYYNILANYRTPTEVESLIHPTKPLVALPKKKKTVTK